MITLYDTETGADLGVITTAQLNFLMGHLEEESAEDRDYYINLVTLDGLRKEGADSQLMTTLTQAMGEREEMEFRWTSNAN